MSADDNKALVIAFYAQAFSDYQPEQAAEAHLGESCTQHNPEAQDGPQAFVGYVHWLRGQFPDDGRIRHIDVYYKDAQAVAELASPSTSGAAAGMS